MREAGWRVGAAKRTEIVQEDLFVTVLHEVRIQAGRAYVTTYQFNLSLPCLLHREWDC